MSAGIRASQIDLVQTAEALAERLRSPVRVTRSAFSKLVATFRQEGDRQALHALVRSVASGRGGGRERGTGYSDQIDHASGVLLDFLGRQQALSDRELQSVFGWTARLIEIADELHSEPRGGAKGAGQARHGRQERRPKRGSEPPTPRAPGPAGRKLGGLGGKSLEVLKALRQKTSDGDAPDS
jgi:hypothetical protein